MSKPMLDSDEPVAGKPIPALELMVWMFNMKVTFLSFALQSKNLILLEGFGPAVVTVYISQPGVSY